MIIAAFAYRLCIKSLSARRAWIEISIDDLEPSTTRRSLSARRAWIEMQGADTGDKIMLSLSARRAWIEMIDYVIDYANDAVALRKESVDRNTYTRTQSASLSGRSPQGERG